MSSLAVIDCYRVQFGCTTYDISTQDRQLSRIRQLFNSQAQAVNQQDETHQVAPPSRASIATIPRDARVWLRWGDHWVEVIDSASLQAALDDFHYQQASKDTTVVAAAGTDSSMRGKRIELLFRTADAASPNDFPPMNSLTSSSSSASSGCRIPSQFLREISDLFPQPSNGVDPFSQKTISSLERNDRVLIHSYGSDIALLVSAALLLEHVKRQLEQHTPMFEIKVTAEEHTVQINRYVWGHLILHHYCPLATEFRAVFIKAEVTSANYEEALAEVQDDTDLYLRVQFLIADMLQLKSDERWTWDILNPKSQNPTELALAEKFSRLHLPSLYFSREQQLQLSQFPMPTSEMFSEAVTEIIVGKFKCESSKKAATGPRVRSSLTSLFRSVFKLDHSFHNAAGFVKLHDAFEERIQTDMKLCLETKQQQASANSSSTTPDVKLINSRK